MWSTKMLKITIILFVCDKRNEICNAQDDAVDDALATLDTLAQDTIDEYTATGSFSNQDIQSDLPTIFNSFDSDGDSYLNFNEYSNFVSLSGMNWNAISVMDLDKDGKISENEMIYYFEITNDIEYEQMLRSTYFDSLLNVDDYNQVSGWETCITNMYFNLYDLNNDGYIEEDDVINYVYTNGFSVIDVNQDNLISYDEFQNAHFSVDSVLLTSQNYNVLNQGLSDYQTIIQNIDINNVINMQIQECSLPNRRLAKGDSCAPMVLASVLAWMWTGPCCIATDGIGCGVCATVSAGLTSGAIAACN